MRVCMYVPALVGQSSQDTCHVSNVSINRNEVINEEYYNRFLYYFLFVILNFTLLLRNHFTSL